MKTKIKVIDAVMGAGKTSYAIQHMRRNAHTDKRYIFVTPYLDEVQRIIEACPECKFAEPAVDGKSTNKSESLINLIGDGRNIVTTHSLFKMMDVDALSLIKSQDYSLIMDEVMDVIEPLKVRPNEHLNYSDGIFKPDKNNGCEIDEMFNRDLLRKGEPISKDGTIFWVNSGSANLSRYEDIKRYAEEKRLAMVGNVLMVWLFPVDIFKAFTEVWNLCYLFKGQMQKAYYDTFDLEYDFYTVTGKRPEDGGKGFSIIPYQFGEGFELQQLKRFAGLIDLVESDRWNAIGNEDNFLTFNFFQNTNRYERLHDQLGRNLDTFFRDAGGRIGDRMWTTFKGPTVKTRKVKGAVVKIGKFEKAISRPRFASAFVACNVRATNQYKDRSRVAYCINRKMNPMKAHFFKACGVRLDHDIFALSEMVQWIWRSRIRTYNPIKLYVPSKRMRELLKRWLTGILVNPHEPGTSTRLVEVDR